MDYLEFKRQVLKAGLTINEFALVLRVRPNALSNLRKKPEVPIPYAVAAVLCAEAKELGIDFRKLLAKNGLVPGSSEVTSLADYRKRSARTRDSQ